MKKSRTKNNLSANALARIEENDLSGKERELKDQEWFVQVFETLEKL